MGLYIQWKLTFLHILVKLDIKYSGCPKTGRPVFGFFEKRPVDKPPVIGLSSDNRTNLSGFQTSGSNALYEPDVRYSDNCIDV